MLQVRCERGGYSVVGPALPTMGVRILDTSAMSRSSSQKKECGAPGTGLYPTLFASDNACAANDYIGKGKIELVTHLEHASPGIGRRVDTVHRASHFLQADRNQVQPSAQSKQHKLRSSQGE